MGIALGFVAGAAVVRMARAALFGVAPNDAVVFGMVGADRSLTRADAEDAENCSAV